MVPVLSRAYQASSWEDRHWPNHAEQRGLMVLTKVRGATVSQFWSFLFPLPWIHLWFSHLASVPSDAYMYFKHSTAAFTNLEATSSVQKMWLPLVSSTQTRSPTDFSHYSQVYILDLYFWASPLTLVASYSAVQGPAEEERCYIRQTTRWK